jgi:hypothetical protein
VVVLVVEGAVLYCETFVLFDLELLLTWPPPVLPPVGDDDDNDNDEDDEEEEGRL